MSTGNLTNMILSKFNHPFITNSQSFNEIENIEDEEIKSISSNNDIGDISNIQLPYNKDNNEENYNYKYKHDFDNDNDSNNIKGFPYLYEIKPNNEQFCSYVLYFAFIVILFGYFGYYIVNNKIIPTEIVSGINLGVVIGFIVVTLLWSSISSS